ncbi:MAG TPA: site-2 protease family protein, partial [Candidatus Paceibacterota bacterium]|nr:site-2 protease family protein [Candidatus Paceibacterota bacterium]
LLLLFVIIVKVNVVLAIFNLVPLPPLDGSKVLFAFLPATTIGWQTMRFLERYGLILVIVFVFFGFGLIAPIIDGLTSVLLGIPPGV